MFHLIHWIVDYLHPQGFCIDRPNGMDMYTILLFKQSITIWQDGTFIQTGENACILFTRGAKQLYFRDNGDYTHDGVFFEGKMSQEIWETLGIPTNTAFYLRNPKIISTLIQDIAAEAALKQPHSPEIIDLLLRTLFLRLSDGMCRGSNIGDGYFPQFQQIRRRIFKQPAADWHAGILAEELHISVSRFHHLYKLFFQSTLTQDVIQSRTDYAQYLLRSSSQTTNEIASLCGYNATEHFIRQFKKQTGLTPGQYRRNNAAMNRK